MQSLYVNEDIDDDDCNKVVEDEEEGGRGGEGGGEGQQGDDDGGVVGEIGEEEVVIDLEECTMLRTWASNALSKMSLSFEKYGYIT